MGGTHLRKSSDIVSHQNDVTRVFHRTFGLVMSTKGGGNSTCVPRRGFPGGRGARKKLRVHGKVKGTDPEFPKTANFKAFLVHNALKVHE